MTDKPISEAAKLRACELGGRGFRPVHVGQPGNNTLTAFARYIDQVSNLARQASVYIPHEPYVADLLKPLILPKALSFEERITEAFSKLPLVHERGDRAILIRIVEAGDD